MHVYKLLHNHLYIVVLHIVWRKVV